MNKPEPKPAQSLEEILASIRKALAEEEVQGEAAATAPSAAPAPAPDQRQPAAAKSETLSGQLAVALNGSGSGETFADDDLADLLAPLPSKAQSAEAEEAPAAEPAGGGEQKDPLWFLARQPAPASEPSVPVRDQEAPKPAPAPAPAPDEDAKAPGEQEEEAALTRLETLRSSLPPLFGGGEGPTAEAEPVNIPPPAPAPKAAQLPEPPAPEKVKEAKAEVKPSPPPEKAPAQQATSPETAAPAAAPHSPESPAPAAEPMASTLAEARRRTLKEAPEVAAQARALEGMIGQLLEPVIRSWLEANLPRLVEKVVREEVARVTADKPDVIDT